MNEENEIHYMTFGDLFEEITFDYETRYTPTISKIRDSVTFYKTTIYANGTIERKGTYSRWNTNNPTIWPKVIKMAEMLIDTPAERALYVSKG